MIFLSIRLKEQQEELQIQRTQLIKENRKAQKKVDQYDKLLDDFVQVKCQYKAGLQFHDFNMIYIVCITFGRSIRGRIKGK